MNRPNAHERILNAAVKIFAEKSFEGSRIEEISREANVPKSLIYYHFKSKDEILEVLINNFVSEYTTIISKNTKETHEEKSKEAVNRMETLYYEFGQRNADLIRVILIDSLKKTQEQPILFSIVKTMIEKELEVNTNEDYDVQERRIAEFFTNLMPNYAYVCFSESWTKFFNIERTEFDKLYLKVYGETHGAYHKNHK
ncbi:MULTISPECIES: TetR/AcrR family transcriptional regulator [unclassified Clostridium]|uniref:TetR/AcrR family transcriptional regulator n=1 Tax=unclassified Clostridium TaxID=2614128 RepID=UPI000297BACE|nr:MULTISPECIES: TetR/AcrR family transcriptional regulator [unclassified Clostridium]EKQ50745.1 MAG: transcriptional regulator [Clostridium sp. Maddingley MBC34-26]